MTGAGSCVFAVRLADPSQRNVFNRRLERLARFYAPLGDPAVAVRYLPVPGVAVGRIGFGGRSGGWPGDLILWGGPLPSTLSTAAALLEASDGDLRALQSVSAVIACQEDRVRILGSAGGLATLYSASAGGVSAWATHAVAASWLGTGDVRIEPLAVAELLACEFVGDERSLLNGVRSLASAVCVDVSRSGVRTHSFWPTVERWAPVPADGAYMHAETAMLGSLSWRAESDSTFVGLTGGLDSRVVAQALCDRDIPFRAFTWGDEDWADVSGAGHVATALGVRHQRQPVRWQDDTDSLAWLHKEVRWTEAAIQASFARPTWPDGLSAFVTGAGGEVGRCFYYRHRAHTYRDPSDSILQRGLSFEARLEGAHREAIRHVAQRTRAWLEEAADTGHRGWARLDVLYGEQRVRHWGRGMLSRDPERTVPAFTVPEVARALASLPTAEKAVDGFHRRFLQRHSPQLALPPPSPFAQAKTLRSSVRRAAAPLVRPGVAIARRRRTVAPPRWWAADRWSEHVGFRDFLHEHVLASPLLREALGDKWLERTREGLLENHAIATELALLGAAPVALEAALFDLRSGSSTHASPTPDT